MLKKYFGLAFAFLTPILDPLARIGDRFLTLGLSFLDRISPFMEMAHAGLHPVMPTRDVTYLTTGLHRLAQPVSMRGPNDDLRHVRRA